MYILNIFLKRYCAVWVRIAYYTYYMYLKFYSQFLIQT